MKYIKVFIAGMIFPSIILPCLLFIAWISGRSQLLMIPFVHFIPLIWGAWNVLYFSYFTHALPGNTAIKLLITGGILGLLMAIYGVFVLDLPILVGLRDSSTYLPLIVAPILYALLWLWVVNPLNRVLGVSETKDN